MDAGFPTMTFIKETARILAKSAFTVADVLAGDAPGPRILIYHQVGSDMGRQMEVTEQAFYRQIDWIENNGVAVDLETALAQRSEPQARKQFVVTFDDGYHDVFANAWPLLRDRSIPFTLYLTTEPVESQTPLTPGGKADPLTWSEIREMLDSGLMTLGAHTHTHADLRACNTKGITEEIERSNELIAQRTGIEPRHFTYPWGYWTESADRVVRAAYDTATLGSGSPITSETDVFKVNRIPVQLSDSSLFFKRKMAGGMRLEDRARRRMTGYEGP
jgi:peptidoglycan/xylan/chitin deacetylase (PgdA/CDA1 family)